VNLLSGTVDKLVENLVAAIESQLDSFRSVWLDRTYWLSTTRNAIGFLRSSQRRIAST